MQMNITKLPLPAEHLLNPVKLSIVLVKRAMSFSGLTRESRQHGNKILASSARMTTSHHRDEGRGMRDESFYTRLSPHAPRPSQGFSLVELSIVLVILGLLTGGILTGQNLIRAAELRSVTTEFQAYQTAVNTFRDKYFAIPGDMINATDFWGQGANCPGANTDERTTPATCNGDGDGVIDRSASFNEVFTFWQHLANAGLIEGQYSAVPVDSSTANPTTIGGWNVPASKLANASWSIEYLGEVDVSTNLWIDGSYGNALLFGGDISSGVPTAAILSPKEAWNIDTKLDDGVAGSGRIITGEHFHRDCLINSDGSNFIPSTTVSVQTAAYRLSSSEKVCGLVFKEFVH